MKFNLLRYLREYGDRSFREMSFSEVDALVLSELSYLKMEGIVPGFGQGRGMSWEEMRHHSEFEHLFDDPIYGKQHRRVFELVAKSKRYRTIRANYFAEWFDKEKEVQFAAVTFCLGAASFFVSFRGTDETLVGWKEDFNMGFMKSIPSQRRALAYLKGVARYTGNGRLVLGGHSKGGNLAVYAASLVPKTVQQRIRRVYSFDGPGFSRHFYERSGFRGIEKKYCKIVPEQTLIGLLLANYKKYRVVESYGKGFGQHDLMQWKIRGGKFVYRKAVYRGSTRTTGIFNTWIDSLNPEQIALFVEILYELLISASVQTVADLFKAPFRLVGAIFNSFRSLDKTRRSSFMGIIKKLFVAAVHFGRQK